MKLVLSIHTVVAAPGFQDSSDPFGIESSPDSGNESDAQRAFRLFDEGKYSEAISLANAINAKLGRTSIQEQWPILIAKSQMAIGNYAAALATIDDALKRFPNSIRIRWIGEEVCRFNNDYGRSIKLVAEIGELASRNSWRYRDPPNQILLGKYFLRRKADAKEVLESFFYPVKDRDPSNPEIFRAIGRLALDKHDYGLAAENFARVVELKPRDTAALGQLAESYLPSDSKSANSAIQKALTINPQHVDSLLIVADQQIGSEDYDKAKATLDQVLKVNPKHPHALAYLAVIAHLENDSTLESKYRQQALDDWPGNPHVDHLIGRELSEKYRFEEGESYQRRSLIYDQDYLPAKMQLAHDLLRLGQELEGWKLADEVFDEDQYSVVAHNLVTLRDQITTFTTLERDGFVVRMDAAEADIYGERVLELLSQAKKSLCAKYEASLKTPIFVEIFPRQQDFAIRTFGLPGGAGFLGVCFGRVITMNSPAAQGARLTSWESVLWHEFCHVVTLQKTENKMPRWLSEGISVYEEGLANPAWGESVTAQYREMILGTDLTPVSQLSGAFLRPASPLHLQFAYFESSLVVEYLVKEFGLDSVLKVLNELSLGTPINDALRRHTAPVEFIDKKFAEFAKLRAESYAPNANWDELETPANTTAESWVKWNADHPDNLMGLIEEAKQWLAAQQWSRAITVLEKATQLSSLEKQVYPLLAKAYRKNGEPEKEFKTLEKLATLESDSVELFNRLLEITSANGDWEKNKDYARRLIALNPLLPAPHRYLSMAAEKTGDDQAIIESLRVLSKMNPFDAADIHFRLASVLHRTKQLVSAKRHAIMALEQAPRYRDAHALLLKIVREQKSSELDLPGDQERELR